MEPAIVSRIAPTPSGYLHLGNAVNFLLTWLAVRLHGGRLLLRIDDLDRDRCKPVYIDDVFSSLAWLGIEPHAGPSGTEDFLRHHSQTRHFDIYMEAMRAMPAHGAPLFACTCSRKTLGSTPLYPGTCRNAGHGFVLGETSMRIAVPEETAIKITEETVPLGRTMGDFILWRRDGIPAYQLVSVLEDERMGVNRIVRGRDLLQSSAAQRYIAPFLQAKTFQNAAFIHHELIRKPEGTKFSKSDRDYALRHMRRDLGDRHARQLVYEEALHILGLPRRTIDDIKTFHDYCASFDISDGNDLYRAIASPL